MLYNQLYVHIEGSPIEFQIPARWHLISSRMTTPPSVLSPNSITLPLLIALSFPERKIQCVFLNFIISNFIYSLRTA